MYAKGSEWSKWDLHVHTASSYDAKYRGADSDELLVEAWRKHGFSAVAITDHFKIDAERIERLRELAPEITIFPGFEMRTDKGAPNLHVIGIFSETRDLITLKEDFDSILIRDNKKDGETNETIVRDFKVIVDFIKKHKGIITIHAGTKSKGIDCEISSALPVPQAIKEDIASQIDIFEIGKPKDVEIYRSSVFRDIDEKPLILCSDNHDPREYTLKDYLWIKADPTFEGLIQTIIHPDERVFIGTIPDKLDKLARNQSAYIKTIRIKRVEKPINESEHWFDADLPINPALVAVIGNKGSGKSALSDIIGHLCKAHNMKSASFLNADRFRKLPEKKAEDYTACIYWCDGQTEEITLGEITREATIEEAQYLPQKYIESVCNDLSAEFQEQIDQVIFSYIDISEKGNAVKLSDLIDNRSRAIQARIAEIKIRLDSCNREIIQLEEKGTSTYRATILANLKKRTEDLARHSRSKPVEVKRDEQERNSVYERELAEIDGAIKELEAEEIRLRGELNKINERIGDITDIIETMSLLSEKIGELQAKIAKYVKANKLKTDRFILGVSLPQDDLQSELDELLARKKELRMFLDASETANEESIPKKIHKAKKKMAEIIAGADIAEKAYQKYLSDMKEWETSQKEIIGDTFSDGSIAYYEAELEFIDNLLDHKYIEKKDERAELIKKIFDLKKQIAQIYRELYEPIERELTPLLEKSDEKIEFNIRIGLGNKEIGTQLLSFINQQMSGIFKGKTEAAAQMRKLIQSTNFDDFESTLTFINGVLAGILDDKDKTSTKVKNKIEFYDLLTSLDYLHAEYNLTLGGRSLPTLSPGERGIVLLVFYLALGKNDIPLIIDQPEDNLDNQSVYSRLVPCIKEAKKKRQVIIVTHNPNIAIACDAEQIICCKLRKSDNHISYVSGSIEDSTIRKYVIDILEGTMPAFELRKLKYTLKLYDQS